MGYNCLIESETGGKVEIACYEQFLPLPKRFQKLSDVDASK